MPTGLSRDASVIDCSLCRPSNVGDHPRPASFHTELIPAQHGEQASKRSKKLPGLTCVAFFGLFFWLFGLLVVFLGVSGVFWFLDLFRVLVDRKSLISTLADLRILCDDWQPNPCKKNKHLEQSSR